MEPPFDEEMGYPYPQEPDGNASGTVTSTPERERPKSTLRRQKRGKSSAPPPDVA